MEREKIKISNSQWSSVVYEESLKIDGKNVEIVEVERAYDSSRRHTEEHHLIFKRVSDGKFFRINYETSVKDEMGWTDCNYGDTEAIEVFPRDIVTTVYE